MIALLLALAADPPLASAEVEVPPMPCELGIDALKESLATAAGIRHAAFPKPNAFDTYYDDAHRTIYFETTAGQPANPAIVRVIVTTVDGAAVVTPSACTFGDKSKTQLLFDTVKALMDPKAAPPASAKARTPSPKAAPGKAAPAKAK